MKSVAGSTAELLCGLKKGDVVELSQVMGRGFDIDRVDPPESFPTLLIFATGSGIRSDFCFVYFVFLNFNVYVSLQDLNLSSNFTNVLIWDQFAN